jgi:glucose/mannose-6-phosphate isomerase
MVLDDLKLIHERDAQDALGFAEKQGSKLTHEFEPVGNAQFGNVHNVVYGAMGGSALAGLLVQTWQNLAQPFEIVRDYDIPAYVDGDTLFIAASYSGNTEETLSALAQAEAKGAQIAVVTGGGRLQHIAEEKGYLLVLLPKVAPSRFVTLYTFRALLQIFEKAGVLTDDFRPQLEQTADFLDESVKVWRPDVPTSKNPAKQIAQELMGKSIVVYSGPKMYAAAYKWKINFNENAKQLAWAGQLPEFNHNEFTSWSKQPVDKPYAVIDLRSRLEHPRVQKRFEVSARLLSGLRPALIVVDAEGQKLLDHLLWTIVLGDFVSLYLALLNGLNPTPLELVEKLKQFLGD